MAAKPVKVDAGGIDVSVTNPEKDFPVAFTKLLMPLIGVLASVTGACQGGEHASDELIATLTACPYGVDEEVLSSYDPDCVRELFRGEIVLIEPDARYRTPSFNIFTPAVPTQIKAVYGARDGDEDNLLRFDVDPPDVLPLFIATDEAQVGSIVVGIASSPDGREHYYWQLNGWRYSLDVPPSEIDRDAALELIRRAK